MTDTTLTFIALTSQDTVKIVDDPSKPGWEDFLSSDWRDDEKGEGKQEQRSSPQRSEGKARA